MPVNVKLPQGSELTSERLSVQSVSMRIDEKEENKNEFIFGEDIVFVFSEIDGFTKEKDQVFPGMELVVFDNYTLDTMLYSPDLLNNFPIKRQNGKAKLEASIRPGFPYTNNEKYSLEIHIWDKKGEGTIDFSMPFTISNPGFEIKSNELVCDKLFFFDSQEDDISIDRQFQKNQQYFLTIQGVENFVQEDGLIFPSISLDVTDDLGQELNKEENILQTYTEEGINPDAFFREISIPLIFSGEITNPVLVQVNLSDTKSDAYLRIETEVTILSD